jgi:hypothetical protein
MERTMVLKGALEFKFNGSRYMGFPTARLFIHILQGTRRRGKSCQGSEGERLWAEGRNQRLHPSTCIKQTRRRYELDGKHV